jgi:hypothetical protein
MREQGTPVDVAIAFTEAWTSHDRTTAAGYVADDVLFEGPRISSSLKARSPATPWSSIPTKPISQPRSPRPSEASAGSARRTCLPEFARRASHPGCASLSARSRARTQTNGRLEPRLSMAIEGRDAAPAARRLDALDRARHEARRGVVVLLLRGGGAGPLDVPQRRGLHQPCRGTAASASAACSPSSSPT